MKISHKYHIRKRGVGKGKVRNNPSGKVFDISTIRGLKSAERYKSSLERRYNHVKVEPAGVDKIKVTGQNKSYSYNWQSKWCSCKKVAEKEMDFTAFKYPSGCSCGIQKEHVHCKKCRGVTQVG